MRSSCAKPVPIRPATATVPAAIHFFISENPFQLRQMRWGGPDQWCGPKAQPAATPCRSALLSPVRRMPAGGDAFQERNESVDEYGEQAGDDDRGESHVECSLPSGQTDALPQSARGPGNQEFGHDDADH